MLVLLSWLCHKTGDPSPYRWLNWGIFLIISAFFKDFNNLLTFFPIITIIIKKNRGACIQAERKLQISTLLPDADNAAVGSHHGFDFFRRHHMRVSLFFIWQQCRLLFTGNVPRGIFCEQSSQKTRELSLRSKRYFLCLSQEGSSFCASRSGYWSLCEQ